jgi:hypothetical protein
MRCGDDEQRADSCELTRFLSAITIVGQPSPRCVHAVPTLDQRLRLCVLLVVSSLSIIAAPPVRAQRAAENAHEISSFRLRLKHELLLRNAYAMLQTVPHASDAIHACALRQL